MKEIHQHKWIQMLYISIDILATELVWFIFLYFRWLVLDEKVEGLSDFLVPAFNFSITYAYHPFVLYPLGCIIIYFLSGYYLRPGKQHFIELIRNTFITALIISFGAFFLIIIDDLTSVADIARYYMSLGLLIALQFGIVLLFRIGLFFGFRNRITKERIIVTRNQYSSEQEMYQHIATLFPTGKEIAIEPNTFDILSGAAKIIHINESPIIVISNPAMHDWELVVKRSFDIATSILLLILLSPLMLLIAILIYAESGLPIIYHQERIGFRGQKFQILKFRTMINNSEGNIPQLSRDNDPRITRVGRIIRKYRLDELPQFINIIRGDMSIVGPRPERAYFIDKITQVAPYYCMIYKVRPGLTSWGPIKVGYTDTLDKMVQRLNYDIAYVENMSLKLDIRILFRTIGILLDGQGK